jgi:hypothetical protein
MKFIYSEEEVMARSTKYGKKTGKKAAPKRTKTSAKKSGRPGLLAGTEVGIVSSVTFAGGLRNRFENGLDRPLIDELIRHKLGYDPNAITTAINDLIADTRVGLIATVGGSVTYSAAEQRANSAGMKPFVSLLGGSDDVLDPGDKEFRGGISLESYARTISRVQIARTYFSSSTQNNQICLLFNPKSKMQGSENARWLPGARSQAVGGASGIDCNEMNPRTQFDNAYAAITAMNPAIQIVIVTGDPTFRDFARHLVAAGNNWIAGHANRWVCYPSQEDFSDQTPTQARNLLHGPELKKAYRLLGKKAKQQMRANPPEPTIDLATEIVRPS